MLRAVLLGVLTLTAVSCKSHDAATSASQTVAAGKVIEVVGTVTLHHGSDTRPLAKGDMIDADDVVETGADGSAVIENQNNNVNWEIGASKKGKLRESLAWTAPKKTKNAKASEQDSTAAGRHAERSAADNSVTAAAPEAEEREDTGAKHDEAKAESAIAAPPAAQAAPAMAPGATAAAPPPPPPPPPSPSPAPPPKATAKSAAPMAPSKSAALMPSDSFGEGGLGLSGTGQGGGGTGEGLGLGNIGTVGHGGGAGAGDGYGTGAGSLGGGGHANTAVSPNAVANKLMHTKDKELKACLKGGSVTHIRVVIDDEGKATVVAVEKLSAEADACVKKVVGALAFAKAQTAVSFTIRP